MSEIFIQRTNAFEQLKEFRSRLNPGSDAGKPDFKEALTKAMREVNEVHKATDEQIRRILSGDIQDVHAAMIAMQKADMSFQMLMQVRNKLVEAYHEVMRMQV
ncbi:MAG: flagellar hook-basal body complex protein FliE [Acidobacteriota bacterium]